MFRPAAGRVAQRLAASAVDMHAIAWSCGGCQLERLLISAADCRAATASQPSQWHGSPGRGFAAAAAEDDEETREVGNDQVRRLAEEIVQLSLLEVSDLTEILQKRLNIQMPAMGAMGAAPTAAAAPAAAPAAADEPKEAPKTEFDVKLTGFEAASKVKIIKEVRTMTSLGLKEAKELVEKAPTVLKASVKKEEAEELQKKLEAVGAKITLE